MKIPQELLDQIAVRTMETWLLSMGFQPSNEWDPNDLNCVRDYGPHRIWTVQARIPADLVDGLDLDTLDKAFREYMTAHNATPTAVKFEPYGIEKYACPCGCGTFLYTSIYQ